MKYVVWKGWYFAYTFDGETVTVIDACHAQNRQEWFMPYIWRVLSEVRIDI